MRKSRVLNIVQKGKRKGGNKNAQNKLRINIAFSRKSNIKRKLKNEKKERKRQILQNNERLRTVQKMLELSRLQKNKGEEMKIFKVTYQTKNAVGTEITETHIFTLRSFVNFITMHPAIEIKVKCIQTDRKTAKYLITESNEKWSKL